MIINKMKNLFLHFGLLFASHSFCSLHNFYTHSHRSALPARPPSYFLHHLVQIHFFPFALGFRIFLDIKYNVGCYIMHEDAPNKEGERVREKYGMMANITSSKETHREIYFE